MTKVIGSALLIAGIILTVFGVQASQSFSSEVSRFFTGSPTDKAMWMMVGGLTSAVVGVVVVLRAR
jgi:hypothetical protein